MTSQRTDMAEAPLTLIVSLWLKGDDVAGFAEFERQAARLMARHGGRIERAIRVAPEHADPDSPFEIHVVTFPSSAAFAAYRNDPDTRELAPLRQSVIARTTIVRGYDLEPY